MNLVQEPVCWRNKICQRNFETSPAEPELEVVQLTSSTLVRRKWVGSDLTSISFTTRRFQKWTHQSFKVQTFPLKCIPLWVLKDQTIFVSLFSFFCLWHVASPKPPFVIAVCSWENWWDVACTSVAWNSETCSIVLFCHVNLERLLAAAFSTSAEPVLCSRSKTQVTYNHVFVHFNSHAWLIGDLLNPFPRGQHWPPTSSLTAAAGGVNFQWLTR